MSEDWSNLKTTGFFVVDLFLIVSIIYVWFEVPTAVAMKSNSFDDVTPCSLEKVRRLEALPSTETLGFSEL
jgi:hypothetical protein